MGWPQGRSHCVLQCQLKVLVVADESLSKAQRLATHGRPSLTQLGQAGHAGVQHAGTSTASSVAPKPRQDFNDRHNDAGFVGRLSPVFPKAVSQRLDRRHGFG